MSFHHKKIALIGIYLLQCQLLISYNENMNPFQQLIIVHQNYINLNVNIPFVKITM
jgi:hypothetical protein